MASTPWKRSRNATDSRIDSCSIGVVITCLPPRASAARTIPLTARLFASVPPAVNTTSPARMPSTRAMRALASSRAAAAASPTVWRLDGLPKSLVRYGAIASSTSGRTGEVAAWSR